MLAPVKENLEIFRRAIATYWQDSAKGPRPCYEFFRPTDDDKKNPPTRISAWEYAANILTQVHAAFPAQQHQNPVAFFKFDSSAIRELTHHYLNQFDITFDVVYDPNTTAPHLVKFHLGLLGFERPPNCNRAVFKQLILSLADRCEVLPAP